MNAATYQKMKARGYYERPEVRAHQLACGRKYKSEHRDELRARRLANYWAEPSRGREKAAAYRKRHPERVVLTRKKYYASESGRRARSHRQSIRQFRERGAPGGHTIAQWEQRKALFAQRCAYCCEKKPLVRDHALPITRGGSNDIQNILPACVSCNSRKHNKTVDEFLVLIEKRRAA